MKATINTNTNIQLTVKQLTELAKQLPKKERMKLATALAKEEEEFITKEEVVAKIKEGLEEVKLYKAGKIELRSAREFLNEL